MLFQAVGLLVLIVIWVILFLAARQYDEIYYALEDVAKLLLDDAMFTEFAENKRAFFYLMFPLAYGVWFLFSCFLFSVKTLLGFNKTWMSLGALLDDDAQIKHFSKQFSDVEITLKDIKYDVLRSKQAVAQAESRRNDLVMYLAHDLKTPLTSVIGYLTLLRESPELTAEQRAKYIGITLEKANRLEQLINEFFEISRFNMQSITLEENRIDLGMMLRQIADEFYPMLRTKHLEISVELQERIMMVADADKLARVFGNLLKNAVAYCYENSTIRIGAKTQDGKVYVKFRNACDPIPQEKLAHIFDKFYRVDQARTTATGGSGLGLAIAKQIVELHGGEISAKSGSQYTDFLVVLPWKTR